MKALLQGLLILVALVTFQAPALAVNAYPLQHKIERREKELKKALERDHITQEQYDTLSKQLAGLKEKAIAAKADGTVTREERKELDKLLKEFNMAFAEARHSHHSAGHSDHDDHHDDHHQGHHQGHHGNHGGDHKKENQGGAGSAQ